MDYPLLPADMDNLLLYTGIMISFDLEKMGRTRGEPQKMSILGIQRPDLRSRPQRVVVFQFRVG